MRVLKISPDSVDSAAIAEAVAVLKTGGTLIYPTETVYGLGASIFSKEAVDKIYSIKGRKPEKPISIALSGVSEISRYAYTHDLSEYDGMPGLDFIEKNLPGPYTIILKKKPVVPDYVSKSTIGIRVPAWPCTRRIIELAGPITSTSANVSGSPAPNRPEDIEIEADLLLDAGECAHGKPSRVIDLVSGRLLR